MNFSAPTPVIKLSIQRMVCTGCGAEANASCNCGKAYLPKAVRAAEAVAAHPEKSDRAIAADIGVSQPTVSKARKETTDNNLSVERRIGLDGKTRRMPVREEIADPDAERDRKECVALNHKAIEAERELAEASGDELTPEEQLEHYRDALVIQAEQAADLAGLFAASPKKCPTALTSEAIRGVYRAVDRWSALLKATAAAARP
jgi:hypothetical protein